MRLTSSDGGAFAGILALLAVLSASAAGEPAAELEVVSDRRLPAEVEWPRDVRWASPGSVYLAQAHGAVVEVAVADGRVARTIVAPPVRRSRELNAERLALSDERLVVGSMAFAVRWMSRGGKAGGGEAHLEYVADLDLQGDRLLLAGIRRDESGALAGDGAIAWLARLDRSPVELRAILPSAVGRGAATMEACAAMEVSAVRFLADGSFVVVPGADPGIFHYDADGRLRRTWDHELLGIGQPCEMPLEQELRYSAEPEARARWLNARRVVEDVVPLADGPAVLVRERRGDLVVWDLVRLREDGSAETSRLPVSSRLPWSRLRVDQRNGRLVLLIATWMHDEATPTEHRLVVLRPAGAVPETP